MKELIKKWWFWVIIAIVILTCIIFFINNNRDRNSNYRNQAITILNQYKKGSITGKEASEKLNAIVNKLRNEPDIDNDYESASKFALQMEISSIASKLSYDELSDTEINKYIKEIK